MEMDRKAMMAIITATIAVGLMSVSTSSKADDNQSLEKCYGIAKAGMNDCDVNDLSCSMKAVIDSDPNYWIYVPKGTCSKIVGGITKPVTSGSMNMGSDMSTGTGSSTTPTTTTTTTPTTTPTTPTTSTTTTTTTVPSSTDTSMKPKRN